MRLKFLFFPIIIVVSLVIFILYIWPEIGNIKRINEEKIVKMQEIQAINDKKMALELIGKQLSENSETESIIKNYLPENKTEERIINEINYLAGDANVSLADILLNSKKTVAAAAVAGGVDNTNVIQTVPVKISLIGNYEKMRIFFDNLQRMPIFNSIKSINITKQVTTPVDDANIGVSDYLSVIVDVDFGYLRPMTINSQQIVGFKVGLDNGTVDVLKKYISQKAQPVGSGNDPKGKTNPFAVN